MTIANNTATNGNGGVIYLLRSDLEIIGYCYNIISDNIAIMTGGGIHAISSTIAVYQQGTLRFIKNRAENGSGIYLEVNPKLYVLKNGLKEIPYFLVIIMPFTEELCM